MAATLAMLRRAVQSVALFPNIESFEPRCLLSVAFGPPNDIGHADDIYFPTTAIAADFDGDRDLDVAASGYDRIAWYTNDSQGGFGARRTITTDVGGGAPGPGNLAAGDINGDGRADLVVTNYEYPVADWTLKSRVAWYGYQPKSGTWSAHTISVDHIGGLQPAVLADLDKDGDQDVIASNYRFEEEVRVAWFENRSNGTSWKTHIVSSDGTIGVGSRALAVGDMNGDGWIDIVVGARFSGTVVTYLNPQRPQSKPDGSWSPVVVDPYMNEMTGVTVGDFNRDGALDVAAVTDSPYDEEGIGSTGRVVWYPGSLRHPGTFGDPQVLKGPGEYHRPWSVEATDLDKDGDVDLLVGAVDHVDFFSNTGNGTFESPQNLGDVVDAWSRAADLNGDGRLDVLSAVAPANRVVWYAGGIAGSVSGRVFSDVDRDGVWDANEKAMAGEVVYIDRNNNAVQDPYEPAARTDTDGRYTIDRLAVGTHLVRVASAVGWYSSQPAAGHGLAVKLTAGQQVDAPSYGIYYAPSTVAGRVFNDIDRDGVWDAGERGLAGQEVYLDLNHDYNRGDSEPLLVTDRAGRYRFEGLHEGVYSLRLIEPTTWYQSWPRDHESVTATVAAGQVWTNGRHGIYHAPATISGRVFNDLDHDGTQDAGEPGIAGRTVFVDRDQDWVLTAADAVAVTDSQGKYSITGLGSGSQFVRQQLPPAWTQTLPPDYEVIVVELTPGQKYSRVDFGSYYNPGSISGRVFNDNDRDGIWEASESPLRNCRVYADSNSNAVYDKGELSAVTNAAGQFRFGGLPGGEYKLFLDLPARWQQSYPGGSNWIQFYTQAGEKIENVLFGTWEHPNWPTGRVTGPFVPGSARYTRVINGGFENGLSGWSEINSDLGTFEHSALSPLQGTGSARATSSDELLGAGFALGQSFSVTPGQVYVLSGMVRAEPGAGGSAYLDLGDAYFEPGDGPSGVLADLSHGKTQFIYAAFVAPEWVTDVAVRVVRDGFAGLTTPNKSVWFDEIAVTPLAQFRAPVPA